MKHCSKCNIAKPVKSFSKNKRKKDGLQTECKTCRALYLKTHYHKNKEYYKEKAKKKTQKLRQMVFDQKHMQPCTDCGKRYPYYVMEFDHLNPNQKDKCIAQLVNFGNKSRLQEEINKCEIVCANCHRERTHGSMVKQDITGAS